METEWGHLGGPVQHSEGKGWESVVPTLRFLCGSPHLCWLRTEGSIPMSKYWMYRSHAVDYGPSKLSRWLPTNAWLCSHCFISWLRIETGHRPTDRSADVLWIVSGAFFLGSSGLAQLCWGLCKRLPCTWTARRKHTWGVHGLAQKAYVLCWSGFPLQGVHRFKSPWLSNMSNHLFMAAIK
jgi:hypothetical protein